MFDIGWTELVVIACVAIIVVGPKDLPKMLRAFGKTVSGLRRMAGDFQRQFDDALREAELDDVKKLATGKTFSPLEDARKSALDFQNKVKAELNQTQNDINKAASESLPEPAAPAAPATTSANASAPAAATPAKAEPAAPAAAPEAKAATGGKAGTSDAGA